MKAFVLLPLAVLMMSCSNVPKCTLKDGFKPFPKCQTTPPERTWPGFDGKTPQPYSAALPKSGKPKAVVIIVPGWDTVTGDYASLTQELVRHGYAVYGSENRSFIYGPPVLQGSACDWHPWVEDVKAFSRFVKAKHPGVPVFWHGQSFGAVQVLQATAEAKGAEAPAGIIVHSPAFAMMPPSKSLFRDLGYGSIAWVTIPHLSLMEKMGLGLTTDETWNCRWLRSDDRLRKGYKVRFLIQSADMGIEARQNSRKLTLPVLAMWGGRDRLTLKGDESRRAEYNGYMACELANGHSTQFYRPEGGHMLTEGDKPDVSTKKAAITAIVNWLGANSP
jgi:acylglycerol lipase